MSEPFDAFITQTVAELEKDGADPGAVEAATFAMQKARLLFTGSPIGTILRNVETGVSATRIEGRDGIPMWEFSGLGAPTYSHETVLEPETVWVCLFTPDGV